MRPEASSEIYSGVQLCETLEAGVKCFRILEYKQGKFGFIFHEHVPRHRISSDNAIALMKTLMSRHRSLNDTDMLRGYLNGRGKMPSATRIGSVHIEYPEPGVVRKYLSHGNINILLDEVINADRFRS